MDHPYTPSRVVQNNIDELCSREQTGIAKYGVTLGEANLPVAALVQHLLEEQLDGANYSRAILHQLEKQQQHQLQEYALLRRTVEQALRDARRLQSRSSDDPAHQLRDKVIEYIERALFRFDSDAILRQAARDSR